MCNKVAPISLSFLGGECEELDVWESVSAGDPLAPYTKEILPSLAETGAEDIDEDEYSIMYNEEKWTERLYKALKHHPLYGHLKRIRGCQIWRSEELICWSTIKI